MPVSYQGVVPDPFRGGREIVLTGACENGTFVGEPESLITKCPSKFTTNASETAGSSSNDLPAVMASVGSVLLALAFFVAAASA